jgi:hypothetical protein
MRYPLDDFTRRRLAELPSLGDLHREAKYVEWTYLAGRILSTYSRRDLDVLRSAGMLSYRELRLLGQLDAGFAELAALDADSDVEHCAHCGDDLTSRHKVIEVKLLGQVRRFHGADSHSRCVSAARWLRTDLARDPDGDDADVIPLRTPE